MPALLQRRERNFFTAMAILLALGVFTGFARTFFLKPLFPGVQHLAAPESYFQLHGVVFSAWIVLLVAQVWLVRSARTATHRTFGLAGIVIAAIVVSTGIYAALFAANRPGGFIGVPLSPEAFLLVPLLDILLFALFVGLAIRWRRDLQSHKRLMLLATLSICQAAFVRIQPPILGEFAGPIMQLLLTFAFVAAMAAWDRRSRHRIHPVTLWAGIPLFLSLPLRFVVAETDAWQSAGRWLMGLV